MTPLLQIDNLSLFYGTDQVVRDLSFSIGRGESFGLVGESGSGKSSIANVVIGDMPKIARARGSVRYDGVDLLSASPEQLRALRGRRIGFVQQDPGASLNPTMRIGRQLLEALEQSDIPVRARSENVAEMLSRVGFDNPGAIMARYPHQISGGQQQRVMIAMALLPKPDLVLLDEPTSGLDVTVEAAVIELISDLRTQFGTSLLFISHNLHLVSKACDRVGVLYAGDLVEEAPAGLIFEAPRHPYTQGLVRCLPGQSAVLQPIRGHVPSPSERGPGCLFASRCAYHSSASCDQPFDATTMEASHRVHCARLGEIPAFESVAGVPEVAALNDAPPIVTIRKLRKSYPASGRELFLANDDIDLDIRQSEILGLVGESGSGKSTLAKIIAGFDVATSGSVLIGGTDIARLPVRRRKRGLLRQVQMVFQNPDSTLNPTHTIGWTLGRAIRKLETGHLSRQSIRSRAREMLGLVALLPGLASRKPKALSGGQRQRVAIARALSGKPQLLLADECVSALDVSVQAAIVELLQDLRQRTGTAILFISHDLALVRQISDRIVVMFRGKPMEIGSASQVYSLPLHPYTEALLSAGTGKAEVINPAAVERPKQASGGCPFVERCGRVVGEICWTQKPGYQNAGPGHEIYCHIPPAELIELQKASHAGILIAG
ncbi:ABC transporter ATP-binding protein [Neorhizobium alkalisoli]|uniref:Peptide/nickel transport system ATP-binding protein n=1 Tax=Neorhizobium alkalisoli TaxID=528178 RepID=A0A561R924_9HYPH|nr:ABC transporter ATP-binding protein [Neorhizobium alkalisoli]TWF59094.1 peptide/nickel transport system ATP-binding protein [Neorhizobium alkalisoli]